jgi:DNA-binding NarL/FixJ family response regulator
VVSDRVSASLLRRVVDGPARGATPLATLTDRELEVFRLIGSGQSTREIGQTLHISMKTVETHRANIKQKLALRSTTDLVRAAISATETSGPVSED